MSRPKYRKGPQIQSMVELTLYLEREKGDARIYYRHKVQSYGWLISMQWISLSRAIRCGWLYYALPKEVEQS